MRYCILCCTSPFILLHFPSQAFLLISTVIWEHSSVSSCHLYSATSLPVSSCIYLKIINEFLFFSTTQYMRVFRCLAVLLYSLVALQNLSQSTEWTSPSPRHTEEVGNIAAVTGVAGRRAEVNMNQSPFWGLVYTDMHGLPARHGNIVVMISFIPRMWLWTGILVSCLLCQT